MFTETLYYILEKDVAGHSSREAVEKLIGLIREKLLPVDEVKISFHEALDALDPATGSIADAALIKAMEEQRWLTLVTCDNRLAHVAGGCQEPARSPYTSCLASQEAWRARGSRSTSPRAR